MSQSDRDGSSGPLVALLVVVLFLAVVGGSWFIIRMRTRAATLAEIALRERAVAEAEEARAREAQARSAKELPPLMPARSNPPASPLSGSSGNSSSNNPTAADALGADQFSVDKPSSDKPSADEHTADQHEADRSGGDTSEATAQAKIAQRIELQQAAWNQGNIDAFMEAYWRSDNLTFASGGDVTRGWRATLERYRSKYSDPKIMGRLTFSDLEFTPVSKEAMLVLGRWRLDRDQPVGGNFSLVWRLIDDQWVIIHDHTSLQSEP